MLNFLDNVIDEEEEISEVIHYTSKKLKETLNIDNDIKVFAISSKFALKAKEYSEYDPIYSRSFEELENTLQQFLIDEKGNLLLDNINRKTTKFAYDLSMHYQMIFSSFDTSLNDLEKKALKQKELIQQVEVRRVKLHSKIKSGIEDVFLNIEPYIQITVKNSIQDIKKNPPKIENEKVKDVITKSLQTNLKRQIEKDVSPRLEKELQKVVKVSEKELASILNEIQNYKQTEFLGSTELINLPATLVGGQAVIGGFAVGGVGLGLLVGLGLAAIVYLPVFIPTAIIGGIAGAIIGVNLIEKAQVKMMIEGLSNNEEKIFKEVGKAIKEELTKIEKQMISMVDKTINSEIQTLNNTMNILIEEKKSTGSDINSKKAELKQQTNKLNSILKQLDELGKCGGEKVVSE